jgi:hypothetical protein
LQILHVQSQGSKERFDAILAQFGFSGLPAHKNQDTNSTSVLQLTPQRVFHTVESEEENVIPDERRRQVKHRIYTFIVKRKMTSIQNELSKFETAGGPFTIDPGTGVKVPNPQLLNERIKNPVFKSRYPRRKNIA